MSYLSKRSGSSYRPLNLLGLLLCCGSIAFAVLYLQGKLGLDPCPLCTATRLIVLAQAAFFLLALIHNPRQLGQRIYALMGLLTAAAGVAVNLRHVWLQNLPAEKVPECGPGLNYLLEMFPLRDALTMIFSGSGECAEIQWRLMGLTLPEQTLALFALLVLMLLYQLRRRHERSYFS